MRARGPFAFFAEPEMAGFPPEMSRRPEVFRSGQGAVSILDMPPVMAEFYGWTPEPSNMRSVRAAR